MDRKKTGNRTGPNRGPVCVTGSAAAVVDRSGCQLRRFSNIYKPGKDRLQPVATGLLVYKSVHNIIYIYNVIYPTSSTHGGGVRRSLAVHLPAVPHHPPTYYSPAVSPSLPPTLVVMYILQNKEKHCVS
jgi:hypothetical protein